MKMNKIILCPFLLFTLLLLNSCQFKELDKLKKENSTLKKEVFNLKKELNLTKIAIIIPFDSLNQYVETATCGQNTISRNKESAFNSLLIWKKFPKGINVKWEIKSDDATLIKKDYKDELSREISHKFSTLGEKEIYGDYLITFPNGSSKIFSWARFVKVKDI